MDIVGILVYVVVWGLVFYVLYWALGKIDLPAPWAKIALVLLVLGVVVVALNLLLGISPHMLRLR